LFQAVLLFHNAFINSKGANNNPAGTVSADVTSNFVLHAAVVVAASFCAELLSRLMAVYNKDASTFEDMRHCIASKLQVVSCSTNNLLCTRRLPLSPAPRADCSCVFRSIVIAFVSSH
jgi:hypothetical protein